MAELPIIEEARKAILQGQRGRAKDLLTRLINMEQKDPEYWLLMSSVAESDKERVYCLQTVLKLDPDNQAARQGLTLLGAIPPDESLEPIPPVRRNWDVTLEEDELTGFARFMANPVVRLVTFVGAGILVVGLILVGIFAAPGTLFRGPGTPLPSWTPTPTLTFTPTPRVRTPTPTPATAIPLWMLLDATYTPIPPYVNTPHPLSEAYRSGMRAFERGDYDSMSEFLRQANRNEPESADILYHLGEAYRLNGEYELALEIYQQIFEIEPRFAPAYLGQALVQPQLNPRVDISDELENAIEFDPSFGEAYLALAQYYFEQGQDVADIIELLETGQEFITIYPEFYILRAKAKLAIDDLEGALQDAILANELDITILDSYFVLAQAYLVNDMFEEALDILTFYGRYDDENPHYWALLGRAYHGVGDFEAALESYAKAIELEANQFEAHLYRGMTYLAMGEIRDAINDLYIARQNDSESFDAHFQYAMVLIADDRPQEAINFFNIAENLAVSNRQQAMVYYNRALAYISISLPGRAEDDFNLLVLLPSRDVPRLWRIRALQFLATATPTPTPSNTPEPSDTPTPTATFTMTPSPTQTATSTSTPTNTLTYTPTSTSTRTPTNSPSPTP